MNYYLKSGVSFVLVWALTLCSLSVSDSAVAKSEVTLKTKKLAMYTGEKAAIKIRKKNKRCTYLFNTNKNAVAIVNKKGKVTAIKKGTARITVSEKAKDTKRTRRIGVCKVVVLNKDINNNVISTQAPIVTQQPEQIQETPSPVPAEAVTEAPQDTAVPAYY